MQHRKLEQLEKAKLLVRFSKTYNTSTKDIIFICALLEEYKEIVEVAIR